MADLSILSMETACLNAWPALKTASDGAWLWRYGKGYTKRANSVQAMDVTDDDVADERLKAMEQLFARHGISPVFRVTPLAGPDVIAALDAAGWQAFEESRVLSMALAPEMALAPVTGEVRFFEPTDPQWFRTQAAMSGYGEETIAVLAEILAHIAAPATGILIFDESGRAVAAALASVAFGIGVYLNVVALETARGKGYGRSVMLAALNWTRQHGAMHAVIQVVSDNVLAVRLYTSLGFAERYRYHYRRPA
ncbi:MAG TPA: GNAT family N-acetyltransferase [Devosiaceae bacterium]